MSVRKKDNHRLSHYFHVAIAFLALTFCSTFSTYAATQRMNFHRSPTNQSIAEQLGWVASSENHCGGYYLETPFSYPVNVTKNGLVAITSHQGLYAQRGVSNLVGGVTINRYGEEIAADKAFLYRDPVTFKLMAIDMVGDVRLREPHWLLLNKDITI